MIKAIFFDLFFTLIIPTYEKSNNEFDILGLSADEWERYAEDEILYRERDLETAVQMSYMVQNQQV